MGIETSLKSNNLKENIRTFLDGKYFLVMLTILTLVFWLFKTQYVQYYFLCIFIIIINYFKAGLRNIIGLTMYTEASLAVQRIEPSVPKIIILVILGIIAAIFVFFDFFRNKPIDKLRKISKNPIIISMLVLVTAMVISLIGSVSVVMSIRQIGIFLLNILISGLIIIGLENNEKNRDYLAVSMIVFMLVGVSELLFNICYTYLTIDNAIFWDMLKNKKITLGWTLGNWLTIVINMALVMCCYLFLKTNSIKIRLLLVLATAYGILGIFVTYSRASFIGTAAVLGAYFIYLLVTNNKKMILATAIITILIAIIVGVIFYETGFLNQLIDRFFEFGIKGNGREVLWPEALKQFRENWITGTGWGTSKYIISNVLGRWEYNYHNYILQMSTCGIFGLLALGYYIYAIVNYTFCKKPFCIAVTIMIVFYLFQGLFDTLFFNKFFMPIFCIFLVVGNIHKYEKIE